MSSQPSSVPTDTADAKSAKAEAKKRRRAAAAESRAGSRRERRRARAAAKRAREGQTGPAEETGSTTPGPGVPEETTPAPGEQTAPGGTGAG